MEELNKNQIVLLVLLVSFVTSIATGIVTVTLMDQAPKAVTQTINRIVERTVEKVVPGPTQVATVIKEVPVIVTEEELIVKVINGASPGVVRIVSADEDKNFVSSGFFVSSGGVIVTSAAAVAAAASTTEYQAILGNGQVVPLTELVAAEGTKLEANLTAPDFSFFKITPPLDPVDNWSVLTLAKAPPSIGQTVVALGFADRSDLNVSVGIVSSFLSANASSTPSVVTNAASRENQGGPLLNIKGEVVGMSRDPGLAVSGSAIAVALARLKQ